MSSVPLPPREEERLAILNATRLLDAEVDPAFEALTRQLVNRLNCPVGMVNLVHHDTVWVLAATGAEFKQIPRHEAFCATTVANGATFCVSDASKETAFQNLPAVAAPMNLRFYAGAPILVQGHALGTVCVVDTKPRTLTSDEVAALQDFGQMASTLAEAKLSIQRYRTQEARVRTAGLTSSDWLWETDAQDVVQWVSTSLLQHTNEPPEAEIGRRALDIYRARADETASSWQRGVAAFERRQPFTDVIADRDTPQGTIIVSISGTPVFNSAGCFMGYRGSSRNITKQFLAEQKSRESDRLLRRAIESFHAGVMITDPDGRITLCNRIWRERMGGEVRLNETIWPDTLRRLVAEGLYPEAIGREDDFFQWRLNMVNTPGAHEIQLRDSWVLSCDQRLPDGSISHFFIDISESKRNAVALALQRQALQESQARLAAMLNALPDLWFVLDRHGHYLEGHEGHPMLVRPFHELKGEPLETAIPPDLAALCRRAINMAHACGEPQRIEYSLTVQDGSLRHFEARLSPMPDRQTLFLTRDMTDRVQAAERLRVSEELYRSVAATISDGLMVVQLDGKVVALNPAGCRILGVNADDILDAKDHRRCYQLLKDDLSGPLPSAQWPLIETTSTGGRIEDRIHPLRRQDGDIVWVMVSSHLLRIAPDAEPFAAVATFRDITQERLATQALAQSEERWKFALEGAGDGVWDWDVQTDKMFYSSRGKAMLGYAEHEIGDNMDQLTRLIHPDDLPEAHQALHHYMATGENFFQAEFRMRHKDGHYLWILSRGKIVSRNPQGQALRVVGTHTDITLIKQAEQVLRDKQSAIAASRAKSEFLSRMSHEIRTPLNAITGFAQLLQLKLEPDKQAAQLRMFVDHILQGSDHLMALINDVLDLQKVESGVLSLHMEALQLVDEVSQCVGMLQPLASQRQVILSTTIPAAVRVLADRQRLRQVLMNVGSNAIKYNQAGGQVDFILSQTAAHFVTLTVKDTGPGMSSTELSKLFQPFECPRRSKSEPPCRSNIEPGLVADQRVVSCG